MSEMWITDRLPTAEDADIDGDVKIPYKPYSTPEESLFANYTVVVPGQPWWSPKATDGVSRLAPPPAPAPTRWVTAMAGVGPGFIAACNDGTIWAIGSLGGEWFSMAPIPQHDASND